jgi:hypothetical protein
VADRPFLSILIPTLGTRQDKFLELLGSVLPQAERKQGMVEVIGLYNHGEYRLGVIRQRLLESAVGVFTAFIDDDDRVHQDYVEKIITTLGQYEVLRTPADSLAFRVRLAHRGQFSTCSRRQFVLGPSEEHPHVWDWGIMTPTRTSLMQQCRFDTFPGTRVGEDGWFKGQLLPLLGPEAYLDDVMYEYRWDPRDSTQMHMPRFPRPPRPQITSEVFRWHEWSAG